MKKLAALIGILILLIPGALSVYFYRAAIEEENSREKLISVLVTAPDAKEYSYFVDSAESTHKDAIALFRSFSKLSEKSEKTHEELSTLGDVFTVRYVTSYGEKTARVYVVKKEMGYLAYFDGGNGMYCLDDPTRNAFLTSKFSLCIYDASEIPVLNVSGTEVSAASAEWRIKMEGGAYSDIDTSALTENEYVIKNYGGPSSIFFTKEPDEYTVTVKEESGDVIFTGDSYTFAEFVIDRTKTVCIEIKATWYQASDKSYYGNASYSFNAYVLADPVFELSASETQPGSAVLLSCVNIPVETEITARITPELCDVKLYRDGANVYTFIPVSYNAVPGDYTLKITYGDKVENIPLTVSKKTYLVSSPFTSSQISADRVEACLNENAVAEYKALLSSVAALDSNTLYYNGSLKDYQKIFSLYKGYGFFLRFEGSTRETRNDGVYFTAKAGSSITAMGDGVVCAVGECAYLGKYVVIDHGYGLRSWYVTLGETSRNVGENIKSGEELGKSGDTGLALKGKTLVMITVADTPVSPYPFWESVREFIK